MNDATAIKNALSSIQCAGEICAVNYGPPEGTAREALAELAAEGYAYVTDALAVLEGRPERDIERAFWKGYSAGAC